MKKQKFNNKNTKKYYHQLYTTFPLHNVQEKSFSHSSKQDYMNMSDNILIVPIRIIYIILDYLKILLLIFIITTIIIMLLHI